MSAIPVKPCQHGKCGCKIDDDKSYCSEECRGQETDEHGKCACGHSDCVVEAVLERNNQDWGK